ncbi:phage resistance protein, partial [Streptomyces sp. NPDC006265]
GETSADRYGTSVKQARSVAEAVASAPWSTLELASGLGPEGAALLDSLRNVARDDQRTADLRDALARAQREVVALVKRSQAAAVPPPAPAAPQPTADDLSLNTSTSDPRIPYTPPEETTTPASSGSGSARTAGGRRTTAARAAADLQAELSELAARHPDATIEITWKVVE